MQSGKVRYNRREDTLLSLSIPMEAVLNKGELIDCRQPMTCGGGVGETVREEVVGLFTQFTHAAYEG